MVSDFHSQSSHSFRSVSTVLSEIVTVKILILESLTELCGERAVWFPIVVALSSCTGIQGQKQNTKE